MIFSVVIPLYNKADFIFLTLKSVLEQTELDFEVLIVDDGSSDDGVKIVQTLAERDLRIRLIRQKNMGVSVARNTGIAQAQGDWIAFLDADDYWHSGYLKAQAAAIKSFPYVDMVASQLRKIPDSPDWSPLPWPSLASEWNVELITDLPKRWMEGIPFFTSSVVVRRTRLLEMQPCFVIGESHGEDLDLWFRIAEKSNIAHTSVPLVAYRTAGSNSLTSQYKKLCIPPFMIRMQQRALAGEISNIKCRAVFRLISQHKITLAREELLQGQRINSLHWLWLSREAIFTSRWIATLFMAMLFPSGLVKSWKRWRFQRVAP